MKKRRIHRGIAAAIALLIGGTVLFTGCPVDPAGPPEKPVLYTLTIEGPENGTLTAAVNGAGVTDGAEVAKGTTVVLTATPDSGYTVESFTVGGAGYAGTAAGTDGVYTYSFLMTGDISVSAEFVLAVHTLTIEDPDDGDLVVTVDSVTVSVGEEIKHGKTVVLTATPDTGYEVDRFVVGDALFSGTATGTDGVYTYSFLMTGDIKVSVTFGEEGTVDRPEMYTLTITDPANGALTAEVQGVTVSNGASIEEDEEVVLTATPNVGYEFITFVVDTVECAGTQNGTSGAYTYSFPMTGDVSVSAIFDKIEKETEPAILFMWPYLNSVLPPDKLELKTVVPSGYGNIDFIAFGNDITITDDGAFLLTSNRLAIGQDAPLDTGEVVSEVNVVHDHRTGKFDLSQGTFRLTLDYENPQKPAGHFVLRVLLNNNTGSTALSVLGTASQLCYYTDVDDLSDGTGSMGSGVTQKAEPNRIILTFKPEDKYKSNAGVSSLETAFFALHSQGTSSITITGIKLEWLDPIRRAVTRDDNITGGAISFDKNSAAKGEIVTVTATPGTDMKLTAITLDGVPLTLSGNTAEFIMPADVATVGASFVKIKAGVEITIGDESDFEVTPDETTLTVDADLIITLTEPEKPYSVSEVYYSVNGEESVEAVVTAGKFTITGDELTVGINNVTIAVVLDNGHAYSKRLTVTVEK